MSRDVVTWPADQRVQDTIKDSISCLEFAPVSPPLAGGHDVLAVGSWDGLVRLYRVNTVPAQPLQMSSTVDEARVSRYNLPGAERVLEYQHDGQPILDLSWMPDGQKVVSGGCDGTVRMFDLATRQTTEVYRHAGPVKCVHVFQVGGETIIASAAWDQTLHFVSLSGQAIDRQLPGRAISMDSNQHFLVLAMSERKILIIKLGSARNLNDASMYMVIDSPLRWQTRIVRCFPKTDAFALASIEGRVAIHYPYAPPPQSGETDVRYTFRCHRMPLNPAIYNPEGVLRTDWQVQRPAQGKADQQHVFHINAMAFHRESETFVTGGGDGSYVFWDGRARVRIRAYLPDQPLITRTILKSKPENNKPPKKVWEEEPIDPRPPTWNRPIDVGLPIVAASYSPSGTVMAYARSYDWSKGQIAAPPVDAQGNHADQSMAPHIMLKLMTAHDVAKSVPTAV